ncbi:hypothetical protein AVEN_18410-1, partial [Araneus ventricosus]
ALGSEDCDCETRSHQPFGVYKGLVHGKFAELTARWLVGYGTFERNVSPQVSSLSFGNG